MYQPPLPNNLPKIGVRIQEAVASIDSEMLGRIWQEIHYRIDVCALQKALILIIFEVEKHKYVFKKK